MTQTYTSDVYSLASDAQTVLANMEANFAALKSLFSGAAAPSSPTPVAFQPWGDMTKKVLKFRNAGATAWLGLFHGDTSQKIYVWRNSAIDGWVVDSSVTDRVLALKGGATYTTGGAVAGTWTMPDLPSHSHKFYDQVPSGSDKVWDDDGDAVVLPSSAWAGASLSVSDWAASSDHLGDAWTEANTASGGNTFRPAAAVGTLQYLDL